MQTRLVVRYSALQSLMQFLLLLVPFVHSHERLRSHERESCDGKHQHDDETVQDAHFISLYHIFL